MCENDKLQKCYIYTRVSTAMQVDGFSLSAQREQMQQYAELYKLKIVGEYCDEGKSGKNDNRPEFQKMIEDIKHKKDDVRYVLVFKLSRFARNAHDTLKNLRAMQECNVDLICVKDGINSSDAVGKMMLTIMSAVAEMELENIHAQTMAGRKQKAREGKWNGGFAPYGYELKDGKLVINEQEAEHIRYIFDLFTNENIGALGVAKRMNAEGIRKAPRQNSKHTVFTDAFVKKVLDDDIYIGNLSYGKRTTKGKSYAVKQTDESQIIRVQGIHDPIITPEQFEIATAKRDSTGKRRNPKKDGHVYLLSGLLKCPACGKSMYGVPNNSGGKRNKYGEKYEPSYSYKCRTTESRNGFNCPDPHQYPEKQLDNEVIKAIQQMVFEPEYIYKIKEKLESGVSLDELLIKQKQLKSRRKELLTRQSQYETEQKALDITDKHYYKHYDRLNRNLIELYDQIDAVDGELENVERTIELAKDNATLINKAVESVMEFSCSFPTMEPKKQKEILGAMVSAIEIFPTKKDTGYLKKISFHIPIFPDEKGNCLTIWDMWPGLLDEDGNSLPIPHDDYEKELIQSIMPSDTDESSNLSDLKGNTDESVVCLSRK